MTRYLSIKTKIYLLTTLLVVFSALITFSLHVHQIWQETEEQQFQQLKSLTTLLDSTLENFDTNSPPIKSEDTHPKNAQVSQKVLFLNQSLQPRIDTLLSAFPDFGAGFYGKSLNSILAFGPGFTSTGLKDIRSSSKARIVYKTRKPYRFSVYSQIRKTQIIAIIHPIIRNDQVIGHVWANVPQAGFHTIFFAALEKQLPLFFIIVMVGFFTSHLVVGRFQKNLAILLKRVKQRKLTRDDSKLFSGELLEIYSEVSTAYNQISDSEKRFKDVVIAFDEMIWETDTLGCYTYLSREDQHLYRNHTISENIANHPAPKNYIGHSCFDLLIPEDRAIIKSAFMTALEGGQPFLDLEFRCKNSRGEIRWYKSSAVPIKTVTGDVLGMRGATRDITQSKQQEEQIRHLAYHDVLTGLPNRLDFMQTLASLISRNDTVAVFFIDIDRFKTLNDSLGHPFGDDILRSVAKHLTKQLPEKALLSRFGGDEFLLTVPNCSQEESEHIADKLIRSFHHQPIIAKERSINLTISIGIALSPVHGHQSETLVKNADVALYQAKQAGRDGYRCCESSMTEEARLKLELEHDLREALEQQQLYLVYQPQVNPETGDVLGVEALIRWRHPEKGIISPFHFIPLAEESQLIIPIGNWVLKQACTQAKQWLDDGYPVKMAVNVSSIQFNQDDYIEQVQETLRLTGLPAHWLELEITESVAVKHLDWVKSRLDALKKLGINLALDDFGTGFSSLSYLKQFPIDKLKIDRAFITDICHSNDEAVMAQAILQMAHGLGMKVVAEGVEEPAQLSFLVKRDCQLIQGYFYSPPVESDDCLQLIRQGFKATPSEHPIEYMI